MSKPGAIADPEILRRVRRIEIKTRRIVTESLSGTYHSAFRGQGMEFAEVREYQPGDDVRSIDWNVTSRATRPERTLFVKLFTEERELTVLLLADVSGSTAFGTGRRLKREVLAEVAAILAFSAIKNRDRVGLIRFSDGIDQFLPPRHGTTHVLRVVREILASDERRGGTDLAEALAYLLKVQRKPAVVFLLSDFFDTGFERPLSIAARRHDVVAIEVFDPAERELPPAGLVRVEDAETGQRVLVDSSSPATRRAFAERANARRRAVHAAFDRAGVERVSIDASTPYEIPLLRYFRERASRMSR